MSQVTQVMEGVGRLKQKCLVYLYTISNYSSILGLSSVNGWKMFSLLDKCVSLIQDRIFFKQKVRFVSGITGSGTLLCEGASFHLSDEIYKNKVSAENITLSEIKLKTR